MSIIYIYIYIYICQLKSQKTQSQFLNFALKKYIGKIFLTFGNEIKCV